MDPQTPVPPDTDPATLARVTADAAAAAPALAALDVPVRAALLEAIADALDADVDGLVATADAETALGDTRLRGEVARTTGQLRLFAAVVREGSFLEATIDHPDPEATPPRPDVRRVLHPLGPVAVFSAGNFPFAFSVAGGDTASALAAGCPVVVKAHPGHPRTSLRTGDLVTAALDEAGAPDGTFAVVVGDEVGGPLVADPHVRAVGFTGSLAGGRALHDVAAGRPDPIPFYGELGSLNPVLVTAAAADRRPEAIAEGLAGSFTMGVGQFCTKPGVVLVPAGADLETPLAAALEGRGPTRMLQARIAEGFQRGVADLAGTEGVRLVAGEVDQDGDAGSPVVLATSAATLVAAADRLLTECFGPVCLLVAYDGDEDLDAALGVLPGSLTVSLQAEEADAADLARRLPALRDRAGRLVWNGWPTGVAVTWAMQHGGPWPATTAPLHTSVGATAIRRFLRPVAYQDLPEALLPAALRDDNPLGIPRRVDGVLVLPG